MQKILTLIWTLALFTPFASNAQDFEKVAEEAIPAVVSIQVKAEVPKSFSFFDYNPSFEEDFFGRFFGIPKPFRGEKELQVSQGSGFLISSDGYIVTNNHVVREGTDILVKLNDGREFSGKVIGTDESTDIALVKIEGEKLPFLQFGNSDALRVGQWVVAIGNPLGLQATLTVGVVSAKGRNNLDIARIEDFIQTDAAINKGNSGGPLLTMESKVAGMNTAIATNLSGGGFTGIGFAIPSNMIRHVIDELKKSGSISRGYLGVMLQPLDSDLAKAFDLPKSEGALVAEVLKDSPAERAGIQEGDLILEVNRAPVESVSALRNFIAMQPVGSKVKLTLLHDKKRVEVELEIASLQGAERAGASGQEALLGVQVETLTKELAENLRRPNDEGVLVIGVAPNSPAALAGIKKGALILSVNNKKVATKEEFKREAASTPKEKPILLLIKQQERTRFVSIRAGS